MVVDFVQGIRRQDMTRNRGILLALFSEITAKYALRDPAKTPPPEVSRNV